MKTLLCCIGRLENQYIREYVEYYKDLGVTNICLYDNNYNGEERFEDVIGDYIDSGFVILKDKRNEKGCQMRVYMECYKEYKNSYDWIMFFDCDEFLTFTDPETKNLEQALSDSRFSCFDMIHVNWMIYTDNGMIYNNHEPLLKRFTVRKEPLNIMIPHTHYQLNGFCKPIIKGGLSEVVFKNPHSPSNISSCCNNIGKPVEGDSRTCECNFDNMYLRHFRSKTLEEFLIKAKRCYPDKIYNFIQQQDAYKYMLQTVFFTDNEPTIEKLNYVKEITGLDLFKYYKK